MGGKIDGGEECESRVEGWGGWCVLGCGGGACAFCVVQERVQNEQAATRQAGQGGLWRWNGLANTQAARFTSYRMPCGSIWRTDNFGRTPTLALRRARHMTLARSCA